MPLISTAKCDLCGAERQATNHWFLGRISHSVRKRLAILSYTDAEAAQGGSILCGESCLHKWLGQNLEKLARDGPSVRGEGE
jgi:hypothetical protein